MRILLWYLVALAASYLAAWPLRSTLPFAAVLFLGPPLMVLAVLSRWAWRRLSVRFAAKVAAEVLRQSQLRSTEHRSA